MSAGTTPIMVVSGVAYAVTDVDGQPPTALSSFVGEATFVADGRTGRHHVAGAGAEHEGQIRFHEKMADGTGKDVRVWTISPADDGGFVASTA
jgi:hypothetical protein